MDAADPSNALAAQPDALQALAGRVAELERQVAELHAELRAAPPPRGPADAPVPLAHVTAAPPPPIPNLIPDAPSDQPRALPTFSAAPLRSAVPVTRHSLEGRLGAQIFPIIGIFTLICGAAYFLKLAIDRGYIGPTARVLIGLIAGIAAIAWSERFRAKGPLPFSYALKAVGTGVLYLSFWTAFHFHRLSAAVALGAMVLVTAWNAFLAIRQNAQLLAAYAVAGGLLSPVLVSTGENHEAFLFSYLLALALGTVATVRTRPWNWLLAPVGLGVVGYFIGWYVRFFHAVRVTETWDGQSLETALFAFAFFVAFVFPTARFWSTEATPESRPRNAAMLTLLPLANAAFLALALYSVFQDSGLHSSLAFLMVGLAALFLGVMYLQRTATAYAMYLAAAVVCLTVAVPLKASGHTLTTAWLAEGLILYWAGTRFERENRTPATVLWVLSVGGYVLGLLSLVAHWGFAMLEDASPISFFSRNVGAAVFAVLALAGAAYLAEKKDGSGKTTLLALLAIDGVAVLLALREVLSWGAASWVHRPFANGDFATAALGLAVLAGTAYAAYRIGESRIAGGTFVLANLVALLTGVREVGAIFSGAESGLERALAISGFLMLYGAALLAAGFVRRSAFVRWQALVLLVFTIGKVFLYDISGLNAGYRVASLMGLGAVLLGVSYAYQKDWLGLKTPAAEPAATSEEPRP